MYVTLTCISWSRILPYVLKTVWCMSLWPVFHGPGFCLMFWRLFDVWTSYIRIMCQYDSMFDLNKSRSLWPIFHDPVILPYSLKTIWCMNIILWDYESVWHDILLQNKCRSVTYISWYSDFVLYLEDYFIYEHNTMGLWVSMTWCLT